MASGLWALFIKNLDGETFYPLKEKQQSKEQGKGRET
jgi:hypothetical protein